MKKSLMWAVFFILLLPLVFAQPPPTIQILSPPQGELIRDGAPINVVFSVQNYESSPEPIHIHFTIDKNLPKMHFNFEPFVLEKVAYGDHVLDAQLVNVKHFPLANSEAHAVVRFSVGQMEVEIPEKPSEQPSTPSSQPVPTNHEAQTTAQQTAVPVGQVYQAVSPAPVGKAAGFMQQVIAVGKGSTTYILLLLLAASVIVGGYYGYTKLVQGHFAEIPPSVQYNQQLYDYIKQCTQKRFPKQAIYNKLRGLGFNDSDLTYHFSKVEQELPRAK